MTPLDGPAAERRQELITDAVAAITEQRAVIEQAKGMLMFIYGIDADAAFGLLRYQSQTHNIKLRVIAEQIAKDLLELSASAPATRRLGADGVLHNAHRRVADVAAPQRDGQSKTGVDMSSLGRTG